MALKFTDPGDVTVIKVIAYVGANLQAGTDTDLRLFLVDPITRILEATWFDIGWFPVESTIRYRLTRGEMEEVEVLRSKPQKMSYDQREDWANYGSILASVASAVNFFRDGVFTSFHKDNEHPTYHVRYVGSVGLNPADDLYPKDHGYLWGVNLSSALYDWSIQVPSAFSSEGFTDIPYLYERVSWYPSVLEGWNFALIESDPRSIYAPHSDVRVVLDWLQSQILAKAQFDGYGTSTTFTDIVSVVVSRTGFVVDYTMRYLYDTGTPTDLLIRCRFTGHFSREENFDNGYISIEDVPSASMYGSGPGVWSITRSYTLESANRSDLGWFPLHFVGDNFTHTWSSDSFPATFYYGSRAVRGSGLVGSFDVARMMTSGPHHGFQKSIESHVGSIIGSSYISTGSALNDLTRYVNNDVLQTFSKLGSLSALMPEVSAAIRGIAELRSGDVFMGLKDLIDFLTKLKLQQSFQYRPNLDFLLTVLPEMRKTLIYLLRRVDKTLAVGRGSFFYTFPSGEFGRESSQLETRTRIVVSRDQSAILTAVLDIRSLGVLPSPSNVWDLIPFSFVVNWFTSVGQRIRDLENIAYLLATGIRCFTHTYRITSPLTNEELLQYGVESSTTTGSETPQLIWFRRDVSQYLPAPRDGRYDFRSGSGIPDLGAAASLIWQLMLPRS